MNDQPIIVARDIHKTYKTGKIEVPALRGLDLSIQKGEMVAVMGRWATHRPAELSGGQRQRVTIARALANNPAIVWADEPTGDLDSETSDESMTLMRRLNREQHETFVLVTHDRRIGEMCDRIIRMRDGLVIDDGLGLPAREQVFTVAQEVETR